jgi:hypothetical protein
MHSLPLVPRLHPALRALLVRRQKPPEVKRGKRSLVLRQAARGIRRSINSYIGAGSLRGLAPFPFWR